MPRLSASYSLTMRPTIEELRSRASDLGVDYDILRRSSQAVFLAMVMILAVAIVGAFVVATLAAPGTSTLQLVVVTPVVFLSLVLGQVAVLAVVQRLRPDSVTASVIAQLVTSGVLLLIAAQLTRDRGVITIATVAGAGIAAAVLAGFSARQADAVIRTAHPRASEVMTAMRGLPVESAVLAGVARWSVLTMILGALAHAATMILFMSSPWWALIVVPLDIAAFLLAWRLGRSVGAPAYVAVLAAETILLVIAAALVG
jgi:hypothetical protein